jgi:hypothetical protein
MWNAGGISYRRAYSAAGRSRMKRKTMRDESAKEENMSKTYQNISDLEPDYHTAA